MKSLRGLWIFLIAVLVISIGANFFLTQLTPDQIPFAGFGFFAWFGFAACLLLIVIALVLGRVLKRKENYYDAHHDD